MYDLVLLDMEREAIWDDFVMNHSVNGTFLQTRRFLNYHPQEKFYDNSIFFYYKNKIAAVCPANIVEEEGKKCFFSHQGSTYGGLVIGEGFYKAKYVIDMVSELKEYVRSLGCDEIYLKITPDILSNNDSLLEYACYYNGFSEYKEIGCYIDYDYYMDPVMKNLTQGKRTNVHNCERKNIQVRSLRSDEEIEEFYDVLCENLQKYHVNPVHSLVELYDLRSNRIKEECEFFGGYLENKMIMGAMMFYFKNVMTAHTQYLCARQDYASLSPMSYMYYWLIQEMKQRGYRKLSWGVCTEKRGKELNFGLIYSKESYGGLYSNNYTYHINLEKNEG